MGDSTSVECLASTTPLPSNPTLATPPPFGPEGASHRLQMTSAPRCSGAS